MRVYYKRYIFGLVTAAFLLFIGVIATFSPNRAVISAQGSATSTPVRTSSPSTLTPTSTPVLTLTETLTSASLSTSTAAWRDRNNSRVPLRLQRTAYASAGGGGCCDIYCLAKDQPVDAPPVWNVSEENFVSTSYSDFIDEGGLEVDFATSPLQVWACLPQSDPAAQVTLIWPDGRESTLVEKAYYEEIDQLFIQEYAFYFHSTMPNGWYHLKIEDQYGISTRRILFRINPYFDVYSGPRFGLSTANPAEREHKFHRGETLSVEYSHYPPNVFVEVGLYSETSNFREYELQSSWVIQTTEDGTFSEGLIIPANAEVGEYVLVAAEMDSLTIGRFELGGWKPDFKAGYENRYFKTAFKIVDPSISEEQELKEDEDVVSKPVETAKAFYQALNSGAASGDFIDAYELLSTERRQQRSLVELEAVYSDTQAVRLEQIELIEQSTNQATVRAVVKLTLASNGNEEEARYDVTYRLILEGDKWYMDSFESSVID